MTDLIAGATIASAFWLLFLFWLAARQRQALDGWARWGNHWQREAQTARSASPKLANLAATTGMALAERRRAQVDVLLDLMAAAYVALQAGNAERALDILGSGHNVDVDVDRDDDEAPTAVLSPVAQVMAYGVTRPKP